jgi:serine/threonine protein kinase
MRFLHLSIYGSFLVSFSLLFEGIMCSMYELTNDKLRKQGHPYSVVKTLKKPSKFKAGVYECERNDGKSDERYIIKTSPTDKTIYRFFGDEVDVYEFLKKDEKIQENEGYQFLLKPEAIERNKDENVAYLVFKKYSCTLHELISSPFYKSLYGRKSFPYLVKFLMRQLVLGLLALESGGIYHLDLKPLNILVDLKKKTLEQMFDSLIQPEIEALSEDELNKFFTDNIKLLIFDFDIIYRPDLHPKRILAKNFGTSIYFCPESSQSVLAKKNPQAIHSWFLGLIFLELGTAIYHWIDFDIVKSYFPKKSVTPDFFAYYVMYVIYKGDNDIPEDRMAEYFGLYFPDFPRLLCVKDDKSPTDFIELLKKESLVKTYLDTRFNILKKVFTAVNGQHAESLLLASLKLKPEERPLLNQWLANEYFKPSKASDPISNIDAKPNLKKWSDVMLGYKWPIIGGLVIVVIGVTSVFVFKSVVRSSPAVRKIQNSRVANKKKSLLPKTTAKLNKTSSHKKRINGSHRPKKHAT